MIYILIAFLLLFLSFYYDFANKKSYSSFWWIFMYWLLVAVAGLRYKVGSDTFAYEAFFEEENLYISNSCFGGLILILTGNHYLFFL